MIYSWLDEEKEIIYRPFFVSFILNCEQNRKWEEKKRQKYSINRYNLCKYWMHYANIRMAKMLKRIEENRECEETEMTLGFSKMNSKHWINLMTVDT